ncbi:MAG TPA: ribosome recycling factor [Candidatus Saccharimonadales bacterium]|nr:ribosome recycling factor [Candidatus Saccharimonadales bacterium]
MNSNQAVEETKRRLAATSDHLREELSKIRTGRAHPGMLDGVMVEAYGQTMPLKAVATITTPEAQLIQVSPFDPANLKAISTAIRDDQSLGLNPADDGRVVRIQIPPLTEETRGQMVKIVGQKLEECLISGRQIRHEAMRRTEQAEKDKQISKDDRLRLEKQVDDLLAEQKQEVEALAKAKEQEILTI